MVVGNASLQWLWVMLACNGCGCGWHCTLHIGMLALCTHGHAARVLCRGTSAPADPDWRPSCAQMLRNRPPFWPLVNRENGTNPAAKRSNPDFVSNGKCKNRIAAQGITTFLDFACCRRPFFGIIDCNQNSHSRPGKTRDCQFWKGQTHRSIRQFKFKIISGNASKTNGF